MILINYKLVRDVNEPIKAYDIDAGIDFYIPNDMEWQSKLIPPKCDILIPSGVKLQIPDGWCMIFLNKSGVAFNNKLILGAQVVDAGYNGEIRLHLINVSKKDAIIKAGMKIAQGLILPVPIVKLNKVDGEFKDTKRGISGFGSTG